MASNTTDHRKGQIDLDTDDQAEEAWAMANEEHLARLKQGVEAWNQWRETNRDIRPDLAGVHLHQADLSDANFREADLSGANLREADLSGANLSGAHLSGAHFDRARLRRANLSNAHLEWAALCRADLYQANLSGAHLTRARLTRADLTMANLSNANLREADLTQTHLERADLTGVDLRRANLSNANLERAVLCGARLIDADLHGADLTGAALALADLIRADLTGALLYRVDLDKADLREAKLYQTRLNGALLLGTNFEGADLTGCFVHGISAWDVKLKGTKQLNLVITPTDEPMITVDNLEEAQFIYLLLHNEKIRQVIDTITSKAVLILGRFTPERKPVLDAIRDELRCRNYLPILFDFEKPTSRDLTETISTLAHMARFIIADLTEAKSIPQELQRIVPDLPSVPVQPLLQASAEEYSMFEHFKRYPWVLEPYQYKSLEEVIAALTEKVIAPAELKAKELLGPMR
jgi:uncharacterized protein YjbI with pentapeptide repeats